MYSTNNHKILLYIVIGLIIVTVSLPLYAAEVEGVYYSDSYLQKEGYDVNNLQRLQHSKRQETQ